MGSLSSVMKDKLSHRVLPVTGRNNVSMMKGNKLVLGGSWKRVGRGLVGRKLAGIYIAGH